MSSVGCVRGLRARGVPEVSLSKEGQPACVEMCLSVEPCGRRCWDGHLQYDPEIIPGGDGLHPRLDLACLHARAGRACPSTQTCRVESRVRCQHESWLASKPRQPSDHVGSIGRAEEQHGGIGAPTAHAAPLSHRAPFTRQAVHRQDGAHWALRHMADMPQSSDTRSCSPGPTPSCLEVSGIAEAVVRNAGECRFPSHVRLGST